jgi:hypothetical protein
MGRAWTPLPQLDAGAGSSTSRDRTRGADPSTEAAPRRLAVSRRLTPSEVWTSLDGILAEDAVAVSLTTSSDHFQAATRVTERSSSWSGRAVARNRTSWFTCARESKCKRCSSARVIHPPTVVHLILRGRGSCAPSVRSSRADRARRGGRHPRSRGSSPRWSWRGGGHVRRVRSGPRFPTGR